MKDSSLQGPGGLAYYPGYFDRAAQTVLLDCVRAGVAQAPLYQPVMPGTGKPFSVRMSNFGALGWVSDTAGYRYQPCHPQTASPGQRSRLH